MTDENKAISVNRWRLVLGGMSDKSLSFTGDKAEIITFQDMEKLLDYLYSRAQGDDVRNENSRQGGQGGSVLNAAEWITKVRTTILKPMRQIQNRITENKDELAIYRKAPRFVPAGQSTQMIIGATPEHDYEIMRVAETLYQKFDLKRVFYSAFVNVNHDSNLPVLPGGPPLLREHRLYQADWLLRYYDFKVDELLTKDRPDFNIYLDPKCDWALRHLEYFPVEINRADYHTLLRVPGIGAKSASRIVKARRMNKLDFSDLKKIGVVLKRALYFITCSGRMMYPTKLDEDYICRSLIADRTQIPREIREAGYQQLSLFS